MLAGLSHFVIRLRLASLFPSFLKCDLCLKGFVKENQTVTGSSKYVMRRRRSFAPVDASNFPHLVNALCAECSSLEQLRRVSMLRSSLNGRGIKMGAS